MKVLYALVLFHVILMEYFQHCLITQQSQNIKNKSEMNITGEDVLLFQIRDNINKLKKQCEIQYLNALAK
jgi:hypothetical protein